MSAHITEASTSMAPGFSVDAIPEIRSEFPGTQIVVLTMQNEPAYARAGCSPLERWATCSKRRQKQNWASGDTYPNPSLGALVAAEPLPGARVLRARAPSDRGLEPLRPLLVAARPVTSR
jgi:hypothetical protein